jgi:chromate transport protein ChrA
MKGIPGLNSTNVLTLSLFAVTIIHAPVILQFYNTENTAFSVQNLLYLGLSLDIGINLVGYIAGFSNAVHSIEGRLNLPFGQGFYATANTVAIINLLIVGKLWYGVDKPLVKTGLIAHFCFNMFLMLLFNSRLSTLIFLLVIFLLLTRVIYFQRSLLFISIFTLPLLLTFSEVIYEVLKSPVFYKILKRVSYEGITGFNGRRDLWEKGLEWIYTQGQGFLWGNGYRGHFAIGLLDELERFWFKSSVNMHMHSSMLEFSLSIGFVGIVILFILMYQGVGFIQKQARLKHEDGILLGVFIYLLFLFQVDNYVYIVNYGAFVLFTLISPSLVTQKRYYRE